MFAAVAAVGWAVGYPLVASAASAEPVALSYDDFNRLLVVPLAAYLVVLLGLRGVHLWGRRLAVAGAGLLVLGNLVEFWLVLVQDRPVFAIANARGQDAWVGSDVGWLAFLAGAVLALAGSALLALRPGALSALQRVVLGLTPIAVVAGFVGEAGWGVGLVWGLLLLVGWLVLAASLHGGPGDARVRLRAP